MSGPFARPGARGESCAPTRPEARGRRRLGRGPPPSTQQRPAPCRRSKAWAGKRGTIGWKAALQKQMPRSGGGGARWVPSRTHGTSQGDRTSALGTRCSPAALRGAGREPRSAAGSAPHAGATGERQRACGTVPARHPVGSRRGWPGLPRDSERRPELFPGVRAGRGAFGRRRAEAGAPGGAWPARPAESRCGAGDGLRERRASGGNGRGKRERLGVCEHGRHRLVFTTRPVPATGQRARAQTCSSVTRGVSPVTGREATSPLARSRAGRRTRGSRRRVVAARGPPNTPSTRDLRPGLYSTDPFAAETTYMRLLPCSVTCAYKGASTPRGIPKTMSPQTLDG